VLLIALALLYVDCNVGKTDSYYLW